LIRGVHEPAHHFLELLQPDLKYWAADGLVFRPMVGLWPTLRPGLTSSARRILAKRSLAALDAPLTWLLSVAFDLAIA
jgi:hypothetical protein